MSDDASAAAQLALRDRVVVVTGAAGGLGRATCAALARRGARLVAVDLERRALEVAAAGLDGEGADGVLTLALDVRSEAHMEAMAGETLVRHGRIDALVACAGILRGHGQPPRPVSDTTLTEWNEVVDTNLKGTFLSNRAVIPAMMAQRSGDIVNISSTSGRTGRALDAAYCATKFGIIGFSEALAEEVRAYRIRVHTLLPDALDTPLWEQNGPLPRPPAMLPPERVAELIAYVLSLPADTVLVNPVIAPFRTRARKPARADAEQEQARG